MDGIASTSDATSRGSGEATEDTGRPDGRKKTKVALVVDMEESKQMAIDLFRTNIESGESKAFFAFMRKKRLAEALGRAPFPPQP
ncbi:hypothetical protein JG687_00004835 [Phytophthora cactorum]|uniref:Uncharacterized protein n=1 Tax=Phytophthora cactorum TaxID=29920 RepID=A0A8T1UMU8_9STRA|nr:hypothetical protein JG687_00004835 [Phytophthora cactorum]